jgi:hypothetical protein
MGGQVDTYIYIYIYIYIVVVAYRLAQAVSTCITYQGHGFKFPPKDVRPLAP